MDSIKGLSLVFLLGLAVPPLTTEAHLCIISPRQRGPFDISHAGSSTCTRHGAPCGGQAAETPRVTYIGGKTALIKFQQNFNHYEVGLPGYMDIALAQTPTSTEFRTLAVVGDSNEHAQWHQRNYTIPVVLPKLDCDHCVLRMRYASHKPGEETFYQCSDISIKTPNTSLDLQDDQDHFNDISEIEFDKLPQPFKMATNLHQDSKRLVTDSEQYSVPSLFGIAWNPLQAKGSKLVDVGMTSGAIESKMDLYFGMGPNIQYGTPSPTAQSDKFVMDQITCYSREIPYLFLLEHRNGGLDVPPNKILWIDMEAFDIAGEYEINDMDPGVHIAALNSYERTRFLTFEIQPTKGSLGNFTFTFATLDYMGVHNLLYTEPEAENLYVNFLWATVDLKRQMYYVLMGNENSPDKLNARLHSFNITSKNVTMVTELDVSQFTISAVQAYEKTGQLLAVSPGLFFQSYPGWYVVEINPVNGTIKELFPIAPPGMFELYYGGTVTNIDQKRGLLYYVFRVADSLADIVATVSLDTGNVTFSHLTSLRFVHNMAYYDPYSPSL